MRVEQNPVVLIAPDKFRGSLTSMEAAAAMASGVLRALPDAEVIVRPVADGGDGLVDALCRQGADVIQVLASGAMGEPVTGLIAIIDGVAYIESAQFCGMDGSRRSPEVAWSATSAGLGEAIRVASTSGARRIVVGLGGSVTTDGGCGALHALGFSLFDTDGEALLAADVDRVARIEAPPRWPLPLGVEIVVAADVDSVLLGHDGAARMYAPQKGADASTVDALDQRLTMWSTTLERSFGVQVGALPGGGAAGGIAAGLYAALGARIVPGAALVLDVLEIPKALARADIVITGEGSLDAQSLRGKLPVQIARLARIARIPVWAIVGYAEKAAEAPFDRVGQLRNSLTPGQDSYRDAAEIAASVAFRFTTEWKSGT